MSIDEIKERALTRLRKAGGTYGYCLLRECCVEIEALTAERDELKGGIAAMKQGVGIRIADLESQLARLHRATAIVDERDRQDDKWGLQDHDLPTWLTILTEEVGELAAAMLCHRFGNDDHPELNWRKEAIQVAAVALSITEQYKEPT